MTKKQRLAVQIIGLVLILFLAIKPIAAKLAANYSTQKQLKERLARLETKAAVLEGIDAVLINERVAKMELVFPSSKPIVALLASLSNLATDYQLTFGGISLSPGSLSEESAAKKPKKGADPEGLYDLRFGFQVGGDFDRISKFMQGLENTAPLMKVEEVALSIKTNPLFERTETMVVADIKVAAYFQAPPESLGSIDKPVKLLSRNEETLLNQLVNFKTYPQVVPLTEAGKENLFE